VRGRSEARVRGMLRRLLAVYPAEFREAMGEDLISTLTSRWRELTGSGRGLGWLRFWLGEVPRFVMDGLIERGRGIPGGAGDVLHAMRRIRRFPSFHALAIVGIMLGVGATTTIIAVTDAVVIRPLPYDHADDLYLIRSKFGEMTFGSNSLPNLTDVRSAVHSLEWIEGVHDWSPSLTGAGEPVRVSALDATRGYLPGLGARALSGRLFEDGDYEAGAPRVVVISWGLWQQVWGGDPGVIGLEIRLDGEPQVVVGVMARAWRDPEPIETGTATGVWLPVRADRAARSRRDSYDFQLIGRALPHEDAGALRAELAAVGRRISEEHPDNAVNGSPLEFEPVSLKEQTIGGARGPLLLLLGAVAVLLLLTCANVANLFLSQGMTRHAELSVRAALGASRLRIARQLFTESLITVGLGGVGGIMAGAAGLGAFVALAPAAIPRLREASIDFRVLVLVLATILGTAIVTGLIPAMRSSARLNVESGSRATSSAHRLRAQAMVVSAEIALALVLLIGSALLLQSFSEILRVDPGFDPADLVVADIRPPGGREESAQRLFFEEVLDRARSLQGVTGAALMYSPPASTGGAWSRVTAENADATGPAAPFTRMTSTMGDAVRTLRMRLEAGRSLNGGEREGDPLVVVLNEAAAKSIFPGVVDPVGRRLRFGPAGSAAPLREVIGVVRDVTQRGRGEEREAQVYVPASQTRVFRYSLLLGMTPGSAVPAAAIRSIVSDVGGVPVDRIATMDALLSDRDAEARFLTVLLAVFAVLSLVLAAVGTYGTASFAITRRLPEIGIRMALGAAGPRILASLLGRAGVTLGLGLAAGTVTALVLTRFLERFVFGISTHDPVAFLTAGGVIAMSAFLASLVPALRAACIDPNRVLRAEG
jgi:putative ABC transport system permease protein